MFGSYAVLRHQEPAGQSFIYFVEAVAGCDLRDLNCEELRVAIHLPLERGAFWQQSAQGIDIQAEGSGIGLNDGAGVAGAKAGDDWRAGDAFFADEADLDTFAIGH